MNEKEISIKKTQEELTSKFPDLKFRNKSESWIWKVLGFLAPAVKTNYTVVEKTLWCPEVKQVFELIKTEGLNSLPSFAYQTLTHELIHLNQIWYGDARPSKDAKPRGFLGRLFGFYLPYLLLWFPFKLATYRAKFEIEAFLLEYRDGNLHDHPSKRQIEDAVYYLTGPHYGWAVSEKKAREIVEEVLTERIEE